MDYEVINAAVSDIITIVNYYNRDRNYSVGLCERLVIALLGYYLVFGPSIFEKINVILEALEIYECDSEQECKELKIAMFDDYDANSNPATNWDYRYDENKKFIGAVPRIIYTNDDLIRNSFSLAHELSHVLEGIGAKVIFENDKELIIKQSLCEEKIDKTTNRFAVKNIGIVELVTVIIENRMFKEFLKLDADKIDNILIRDFVRMLEDNRNKNVFIDSYEIMASIFSNIIENEKFFELIKKYYYANEPELFALEYNSYGEGLNFNVLRNCAENIKGGELYDLMYYSNAVRRQIELFNKYTGFEPDKRVLIFV